jgi:hypothetical protein
VSPACATENEILKRVARLMREAGIQGLYRRRRHVTTVRDPAGQPSADLVTDAVGMAILRRRPDGGKTIPLSGHGSQYTSWTFGQRLRAAGPLSSSKFSTRKPGKPAANLPTRCSNGPSAGTTRNGDTPRSGRTVPPRLRLSPSHQTRRPDPTNRPRSNRSTIRSSTSERIRSDSSRIAHPKVASRTVARLAEMPTMIRHPVRSATRVATTAFAKTLTDGGAA